jgi:hypothetical protein
MGMGIGGSADHVFAAALRRADALARTGRPGEVGLPNG